jgi:hypothetical protein
MRQEVKVGVESARSNSIDGRSGCLDSQTVKTSVIPSSIRGCDGGKLTTGRKRHILVDTCGLLLAVLVTAVSIQDRGGARLLLSCLAGFCNKLCLIRVDGAYRRPLLNWASQRFRCRLPSAVGVVLEPTSGGSSHPK